MKKITLSFTLLFGVYFLISSMTGKATNITQVLFQGEVSIQGNSDNTIYVFQNTTTTGEYVFYRLQTDQTVNSQLRVSISNGEVSTVQDGIVVENLDNNETTLITISGNPKTGYDNTYIGFGLQQHVFPTASSNMTSWNNAPIAYDVYCACATNSGANCSAGGIDATSCSISDGTYSCSVSCGGSSFACCNTI